MFSDFDDLSSNRPEYCQRAIGYVRREVEFAKAVGGGSLDLDTLIRALYLIGYSREGCCIAPEPLGPGAPPTGP